MEKSIRRRSKGTGYLCAYILKSETYISYLIAME